MECGGRRRGSRGQEEVLAHLVHVPYFAEDLVLKTIIYNPFLFLGTLTIRTEFKLS